MSVSAPRRLIVEADGGSRGNPGPAAYGALVRDADTGAVLAEVGVAIGVATNNVAEYRGLIAGLEEARAIDPEAEVEARLDSKLVVEQMSGRWKIKNAAMKPLALEANRIFPPGQVTYTWVPRAQNSHADRLVNQALDGKPIGGGPTGRGPVGGREAGGAREAAAPRAVAEAADEPTSPGNRLAAWSPELGPPTTILAVRHGQTTMTLARQFSGGGIDGPPLDAMGLEQAERAAARLAGSEAVAVVSSPMLRARQTAETIAARLGVDVRVDDGWRECDFGAWDGLTLAEVAVRFPTEHAEWHHSTASAPPGGESLDHLTRRIAVARDRTMARYAGRTVVVVTHSMPVRALMRLALDAPPSSMFRLQPAPGSVSQLDLYNDGTTAVAAFSSVP